MTQFQFRGNELKIVLNSIDAFKDKFSHLSAASISAGWLIAVARSHEAGEFDTVTGFKLAMQAAAAATAAQKYFDGLEDEDRDIGGDIVA